mgnify:CR=1 FL=1
MVSRVWVKMPLLFLGCCALAVGLLACSEDSNGDSGEISAVDAGGGGGGISSDIIAPDDTSSLPGLDGITIPDGGFQWPDFDALKGDAKKDAGVVDAEPPPLDVVEDTGPGPEPDAEEDVAEDVA